MVLAGLTLALAFSGSSAISAPFRVPATTTSKVPAIPKSQLSTATTNGAIAKPNGRALPALPASSQPLGPWTMGNPYPTTIVRYGFAQTATDFYVFGGVDNGSTTNAVNRMDIATGVWQSRAPMPFSGEAPTCALMASTGIVYCADGLATNSFAAYNIATDTWTPLASDPFVTDHYGSASGAFNGKVFVAGGTSAFSSAVDVYDVATNTWSAGTSAPDNFLLAGYQQVGQFLYLAGGWTGGVATGLTTTRRLDMSSAPGVWINGPTFTMGRSDFGLAYDAGMNKLYALGGDVQGGGFFDSTNEVDELDLTGWPGGTWNASPPNLPLPVRQANQAGFYNGDIWSVGGIDGTTFTFLAEVWHRTNGGISCAGCSSGYVTTTSTGTIVPGTVDTGNHCDDCATPITFPFPVSVYGQNFNSANVSSNGSLDLTGTQSPFTHGCLTLPSSLFSEAILPYQDDLETVTGLPGCSAFSNGCGIFTSVSGTAPNRTLYIEWHAVHFANTSTSADFELVFYENSQTHFDIIYGATSDNGSDETSGVQASATGPATTFSCGTATLTNGLDVTYTITTCPAPVPTDAVSRKVHGAAGTFDIELPRVDIHGAVGIEDRTQGTGGATCGAWQVRTPFGPPTSYGGAGTSDGTYAYVAGGYSFDAGTDQNIFQRFDPVANAWTVLAPMPDAVTMASAVYSPVNNKVYVFGGENITGGTVSNATRIYDIPTNTWSAGANMPDIRAFMASGYYNGKIYLIAGYNTPNVTSAQTQVWEYDPIANTFNTTRMPYPNANGTGGPGFGIINGHFYVAGGRDLTNTVIALVYDYNIATDTWTPRASMPAPNNVPGSGVENGQLALFGGGNPFSLAPETTGATVIYNPATDTWAAGPTLNQIRSFPAGTNVGNTLVAAGGYTGSTTTGSTETVACGTGAFAHQMVVTFATNVTVQSVSVTSGTGNVDSFTVSGNVVTINLSGVTNAQRLGVTLHSVCDGTNQGDVLIPMGVLSGDVNGNGTVSAADVALTKAQVGHAVGGSNFREDVNANGVLNAIDVAIVKSKTGTALPP